MKKFILKLHEYYEIAKLTIALTFGKPVFNLQKVANETNITTQKYDRSLIASFA